MRQRANDAGPAPMSVEGPRYELEFEDSFDGDALDESRWPPYYPPQWSSRERSAARYAVRGGAKRFTVDDVRGYRRAE